MKKYLAYLEQDGGCDYTIGCGISKLIIEAEDIKEAKNKIEEILEESWLDLLDRCTLYEISDELKINVDEIYNKAQEREKDRKRKQEEKKDRKEYERLVKKFGD